MDLTFALSVRRASFSLALLFVTAAPLLASPAKVEVNGIRFIGSWGRPVPGDGEIWGEYYYRVIAENIGQKDQTLLLGRKIITDGFQGTIDQISRPEQDPLKDDDNSFLKPVLGDLRPLTLKPGERGIIAQGLVWLESDKAARVYRADRGVIIYSFAVREEMKRFYDVWIGEAELRFSLVPGRSDRKDEGKPDPNAFGGPIPWKCEQGWSK